MLLRTIVMFAIIFHASAQDKTYSFPEEEPEGSFVGNIARDLNLAALIPTDVFRTLQYSLMAWEDGGQFRVDKDNSDLFAKFKLDREQLCRFKSQCLLNLRVVARSAADIRKYWIVINLLDINDNAPIFPSSNITLSIPESVTLGMKYSIPSASDDDRGSNTITSYSIEPNGTYFSIDYLKKLDGTFDVSLVVNHVLDREAEEDYHLVLVARDGGSPSKSGSMLIDIKVTDINDNTPSFQQSQYAVKIGENTVPGAVILTLTAVDGDIGINAEISYRLSRNQYTGIAEKFAIDPKTGVLSAKVALPSGSYTVIVEAVDAGNPQRVNQTEVAVTVVDTMNNPPEISIDPLNGDASNAYILESASYDTMVAYVSVSDPDSGDNGAVTCYSQSSFFDLRPLQDDDYKVVVVRPLDREEVDHYTVTVFCEDAGNPRLSATTTFEVNVGDVNDNPPVFDKPNQSVLFSEDNAVNDIVMVLSATDKDAGDNAKISYSLIDDSSGFFRIPAGASVLTCAKVLDRETQDTHVVKILARDGGSPSLSATATVTVKVLDVNDVTPKFFQLNYKFSVLENLPAGALIGTVSAFDLDLNEGGDVRFSMSPSYPESDKFQVLANGTIMTLVPLDREVKDVYHISVMASDNGQPRLSSQADVQVLITDVNDNSPVFLFPSSSNNTITLLQPIDKEFSLFRLQATDADEGKNGDVQYSLQTGNASRLFSVNSVTGDVYADKKFADDDEGDYNLTITATDKGDKPLSTTKFLVVHVKINPASTPVQGPDTNVMIAGGLVCGTGLVSALIVLAVCCIKRRDKGKRLRYLGQKGENLAPKVLDPHAHALPKQSENEKSGIDTAAMTVSSTKETLTIYTNYQARDTMSSHCPSELDVCSIQKQPTANSQPRQHASRKQHDDEYRRHRQPNPYVREPSVQLSLDTAAKDEHPYDRELNRVTSLRLQQAFQHISSFKSHLIKPSDTTKPYEWREIHIPSHPGDFSSLSSRGTTSTTTTAFNNCTVDSGIGTDDDNVFVFPRAHRGVVPSRHKQPHGHQHPAVRYHQHPTHPSLSSSRGGSKPPSLTSLAHKPSSSGGGDAFAFSSHSAPSSDSYPSETIDDQCTTTSGSYSIAMDDHCGVRHGSLQVGPLGHVQHVYV